MLTLRDLQLGTRGELWAGDGGDLDGALEGIATDHRTVVPGCLFVAIRGERFDGHSFIPQALEAGARAVLLSDPPDAPPPPGVAFVRVADTVEALGALAAYWRARMPARVVGVTGSVGKTTTKEAIADVLSARYATQRTEGSLNNEIGLPLTLLRLRPETERAVLEMGGAYALGEITYLCSLARPAIGVVTNVGPVHLERMGTVERIAETKAELVTALPPDGVAALNRDDPLVAAMASSAPCPVLWYGLHPEAAVRADEVESRGFDGVRLRLHIGGRSYPVESALLGRHSVYTVLAAAAVAHAEGMTDEEIVAAVRGLRARLRLLVRRGVNGSTIIDDAYNASPASVLAALALLEETPGRKVAVLGDMAELGGYAAHGHMEVGERAGVVCDLLYTVGRLARTIGRAAQERGMDPARVRCLDTAAEAYEELRQVLREGDVVLVKGSRVLSLDKLAASLAAPEAVAP